MPIEQQKPVRYDARPGTPENVPVIILQDPTGELQKQFHLSIALQIFNNSAHTNYRSLIGNIAANGLNKYTAESPSLAKVTGALVTPEASVYTSFDPSGLNQEEQQTLTKSSTRLADLTRRYDVINKNFDYLNDKEREDAKLKLDKLTGQIDALENDALGLVAKASVSEPVVFDTDPPSKSDLYPGVTTATPLFERIVEEQNNPDLNVKTGNGNEPPKPPKVPKVVKYAAIGGGLTAAVATVVACGPEAQVTQPGIYVQKLTTVPEDIKAQIETQTHQKLVDVVGIDAVDEKNPNSQVVFYFVNTNDEQGKDQSYVMFKSGDSYILSPYQAVPGIDNQGNTYFNFDTRKGEVFISYELNQSFQKIDGESDNNFQTRILTSLVTDQQVKNTLVRTYKNGAIKEIKFRDPYSGRVVTITSQNFMDKFFKAAADFFNPFPQIAQAQTIPTITPQPSETPTVPTTPQPTNTSTTVATASPTNTPTATVTQEPTATPDAHQQLVDFLNSSSALQALQQYGSAEGFNMTDVQTKLQDPKADVMLKDSQGIPFEILVDPQTNIPLFIKENNNFKPIGLRDLESRLNLEAGDSLVYITADHGKGYGDYVLSDEYHQMLANNYSIITLAQGTYWKWFERTKDAPIDSYSRSDIQAQIKILKNMKQQNPNLKIRIAPFGSFPEGNPDWLQGLTPDDAKLQLTQHMQQLFDLFKQNGITPDEYVVVNEPFFRGSNWVRQDTLYNILGYDYITYAFTNARKIVGDGPLLIYNDTANNSEYAAPYNYYTNLTKQQAAALKQAGIANFAVGMQMHLFGNAPIDENDLIKTMQDYGAPIYITELDVDVSMLSPQAKNKALSDIYTSVFRAAIKSGVCKGISTWNGVDDLSNPVDYLRKSGASPTLFSGSLNPVPKDDYYQVLKLLASNFSK